jgi:hypothetical protein
VLSNFKINIGCTKQSTSWELKKRVSRQGYDFGLQSLGVGRQRDYSLHETSRATKFNVPEDAKKQAGRREVSRMLDVCMLHEACCLISGPEIGESTDTSTPHERRIAE